MNTKNIFKKLLFVSLLAAVAGCTGGGGGSVTGSSGGATSGSITTSAVYPTASGAGWTPITSAGRFFIKGLNLSIDGACARGIATVSVTDGVTTYAQATCAATTLFSWVNTFAAGDQGDKTLTLTGLDINGNPVAGATASVQVRVDGINPASPVVTDPASSPYSFAGSVASYLIQGTASVDTVTMTGPGGVTITPDAGHNWTYTAALTQGATLNFTFYSFDLAGNQSPGTTQTIVWAPDASIRVGGQMLGGPVTDVGTSYSMETSGFTVNGFSTDGGTSYSLLTGFNFITNQVRSDPN